MLFFLQKTLIEEYRIRYPVSKIGEDGPFTLMALFHARSFRKLNKILFTYWENHTSCLHTSTILKGIQEGNKANIQVEEYFRKYGVSYDAQKNHIWTILSNLPRICAQNKYNDVIKFMSDECMQIVCSRTDIQFRKELMDRLAEWKDAPKRYWRRYRILLGFPLCVKRIALQIPGLKRVVNYLYNRFYRGFTPVGKEK